MQWKGHPPVAQAEAVIPRSRFPVWGRDKLHSLGLTRAPIRLGPKEGYSDHE